MKPDGKRMRSVLTVAGSDCSGGAGIQADLKTIGAFGLYGMSAVTAVTVQNTCGVYRVEPMADDLVEEQLRAVFEDIVPDAVKIGMVVNAENIRAVASVLREWRPVAVLDPVLLSTSGKALLDVQAVDSLTSELFSLVELITPNLPEAEYLLGRGGLSGVTSSTVSGLNPSGESMPEHISSDRGREMAAKELSERYGCSVLIKGGHGGGGADDLLYNHKSGECTWFRNERISSENTHGTGCTLSSAIACGLACGQTLEESVREAKGYITGAIRDGMNLGKGNGPLNHCWRDQNRIKMY